MLRVLCPNVHRTMKKPVTAINPVVNVAGIKIPVNVNVPMGACLPMPPHFVVPDFVPPSGVNKAAQDFKMAFLSLAKGRSTYLWGMPGCGKDTVLAAFSALTRRPTIIRSIKPNSDIQSWFYSRAFSSQGTLWEEGPLLKAIRDGYTCPNGDKVPYMIIFTDLDRADTAEAEYLRTLLDTRDPRIEGPEGVMEKVFPGTLFAATGNTNGMGDSRGRCISAKPQDASLFNRLERVVQMHYFDWEDEQRIIQSAFAPIVSRCSDLVPTLGRIIKAIRASITAEQIYGEFTIRDLYFIMSYIEDLGLSDSSSISLRDAFRVWMDRLDPGSRANAESTLNPYLKTLSYGPPEHYTAGETHLNEAWK